MIASQCLLPQYRPAVDGQCTVSHEYRPAGGGQRTIMDEIWPPETDNAQLRMNIGLPATDNAPLWTKISPSAMDNAHLWKNAGLSLTDNTRIQAEFSRSNRTSLNSYLFSLFCFSRCFHCQIRPWKNTLQDDLDIHWKSEIYITTLWLPNKFS